MRGARFCGDCGKPTPPLHIAAGPPPHLAPLLPQWRASLEGERKLVTVMFADIKGSLELLTARDPEEAVALLDPVIELMKAAVHRYEGTVNQIMGDGIMALFGAPAAHEDHAAARLLRRPRHAGRRPRARPRSRARQGPVRRDPGGHQLRRGGRPRDRQRYSTWISPRSARRPTSPRGWRKWRRRARSGSRAPPLPSPSR
jgi:class 3 adenylate cyclase